MAPKHLVVVCCHGIWVGDPASPDAGARDEEWLIADFQAGETPTYVEHIRAGLRVLKEDPEAYLLFSGGPTRPETRLSEAESYARLAAAHGYFGQLGGNDDADDDNDNPGSSPPAAVEAEARRRVGCETRALDSYGNVLFSLVAFWRRHRAWPARLTVVSHGFKRARLADGHCGAAALAWPPARLAFVGADPPAVTSAGSPAAAATLAGAAAALADWRRDPHGTGPALAAKRRRRNPWGVSQDLFDCDEDRRESRVRTIRLDGQEVLDPDATQPWSSL